MHCRQQVEDLLIDVCSGIDAEELPAALQGLTAASDHVRMAALSALEFVPALAQGEARCGNCLAPGAPWPACAPGTPLQTGLWPAT